MARTATRPLRHLLASLLFTSSVLSLPSEIHIILENREVAQAAAPNWVTVGSDTIAVTVTPTVTGSDGKTTTYGNPPESLTTTGTYTLLPLSAAPTTSTGLPPVATASSDGTGTYLACDDYASTQDAPFCQPKSGTQLTPGNTYFVTWSPTSFFNTSTWVELQGTYHDGSGGGFTSPRLQASQLYYAWTIDANLLSSHSTTSTTLNVTLSLVQFADDSNTSIDTVDGPTVIITRAAQNANPGNHGVDPVQVAVPIVIIVLLLSLIGFCVFRWRKTGRVPILGSLGRRKTRGGEGYGIGQSRSQRVGETAAGTDRKVNAGEVELTDRDSWSPTGSPQARNVFREEVSRQERER